ncbi:MAG: 3-deoxy-D-manno-octulosonic-acid transferase [Pseudomonadota bacterium]|nr:3-deoxy-D-manno-octulosonic-acid transferase [Pseudomonadota bacterium]
MRYLYSILLYIISPFILFYLKKRGQMNPDYKLNWGERFGIKLINKSKKPLIWLHAVSVGETRAMAKLVLLLESEYPEYQMLITHMTPTGRTTAGTLYPKALLHYLPYDMPHAIINFYKTFKPKLGLIIETEIWPNLIHYAPKYNIPIYLINARLSDKSFKWYKKIKWVLKPILNDFTGILCQDQNSAKNFKSLGFKKEIPIFGNTKFDIIVNENIFLISKFLKQNIQNKKVVVFASTRDGEEKLIIEALPKKFDYLIIIIPRHPERFSEVENLLKQLKYQKRSDNKPIYNDTQILLGDSMGEMMAYYSMADIAVIGGSFSNCGGQNLIEPLYLHKPVIFGKSMFNFAKIAEDSLNHECAIQVDNINSSFNAIDDLFTNENKYKQLSANCSNFISIYQGASQSILNVVKQHIRDIPQHSKFKN